MSAPMVQTDLEMGDVNGIQTAVEDQPPNVDLPETVEIASIAPVLVIEPDSVQENPASAPAARLTPEDHEKRITESFPFRLLNEKALLLERIRNMHVVNIQRARDTIWKHEIIRQVDHNSSGEDCLGPLEQLYKPLAQTLREGEQIRVDLEEHATALRIYHEFKDYVPTDINYLMRGDHPQRGRIVLLQAILEGGQHGNLWDEATLLPLEQEIADCTQHQLHESQGWLEVHHMRRDVKLKAKKDFLSRLYMALFGGLALVSPMLIMTLHESKVTSLVTTSVCVIAVAVALAWFMKDAQPKDIIGATAAYAAVLVVFVGTGTNTT